MNRRLFPSFSRVLRAPLAGVVLLVALAARPTEAAADSAHLYVVDVVGDRLDPQRVRAAVAKELGAAVVAPDDPRAASAEGRLKVEARSDQHAVTVTYTRASVPVTRTVDAPADAAHAENAVVVLAGNLARDEASDVLERLPKPKRARAEPGADPALPVAPADASAGDPEAAAARDFDRALAFHRTSADEAKTRRTWATVTGYGVGAVTVALGTYLLTVESKPVFRQVEPDAASGAPVSLRVATMDAPYELSGAVLIGFGAGAVIGSTLGLFMKSDEEKLARRIEEIELEKKPASERLRMLDDEWGRRAEDLRRERRTWGFVAIGVGIAGIGGGMAAAIAVADSQGEMTGPGLLVGVSLVNLVVGVSSVLTETPTEQSYRAWKAFRDPRPRSIGVSRLRFGAAPLPGGASAGVSFAF